MPQKQQSHTVPQPILPPFPHMPKPRTPAKPPPLPPPTGRESEPSSSLCITTYLPFTPPLVQSSRTCKIDGCNETLEPDTLRTRCFRCVLQDWKLWGRKREEKQDHKQGQEKRGRKKRKVVSWADEVQGNGGRAASRSSFAGSSPTMGDRSTQSESTSTQASSTLAEAVCHPASSPKLELGSSKLASPVPSIIRGWEGDLTELTNSSDSSDPPSETDGDDPSRGSSSVRSSSYTKRNRSFTSETTLAADVWPQNPHPVQSNVCLRCPRRSAVYHPKLPKTPTYRVSMEALCRLPTAPPPVPTSPADHPGETPALRHGPCCRHHRQSLPSFLPDCVTRGSDAVPVVFCSMILCRVRHRRGNRLLCSLTSRLASGCVRRRTASAFFQVKRSIAGKCVKLARQGRGIKGV